MAYLCKNIPERSIFYVITKNRSCLNVLNLALYYMCIEVSRTLYFMYIRARVPPKKQ